MKPVGLLYVGSVLLHYGFDVTLIDLLNRHDPKIASFVKPKPDKQYGTGKFHTVEISKPPQLSFVPRKYKRYGAPEEFFIHELKGIEKPDAFFVTSSMTYWWPGVRQTIEVIKRVFPNALVVLGGVYARIYPDHARLHSGANIVYSADLSQLNTLLSDLFGESFDDDLSDWFERFDPAYELYDRLGYLVFFTSLGCVYNCSYCLTPKLYGKWVYRDHERILRMIRKYVHIFNVKDVVFFDDAALIDKENHFKPLLRKLIRANLGVRYHLPNGIHARLIDEELAWLLKQANFVTIKLGYETSGPLQNKTGGKVQDEDILRAAQMLRSVGFTSSEIQAYIMVNMPGQTEQDVMNAIETCRKAGISISLNEYTPIPNTTDWLELTSAGMLPADVDPFLLNNTVLPYWWKAGMDVATVQRLKDLAHGRTSTLRS
ncbi:radical SAM protein [Pseudothermotoga hypogea DSM 11164 = NBRC 106472]|uniref:Radical SAM protein n=1 Tax=Pseudothermotoga hypogea DSM 11164 = NBRC 106472 TaxID=1123384 RepID=A0A0X1KTH4_9THEM|nr:MULTISPECIES: B12-binding domain-containing radical SAM protein [Pseudothermotoga]AJC74531.1 radical SAM protein [Pseudothermotoga hypogea DSM 11164 = NBRC 106472]MDI6862984.1 B12-binding domain-containing radical SAM protein [Pseudothermotoga sp.]